MLAARDRRRRGRGLESASTAARRARVDAALVGLLFCGELRRAETAALVWADVEPTARDGQLLGRRVRLRGSDPDAEHEDFRLLVGPFARALEELRAAVGPAGSARVIPLSPYRINERLQALAERAGLAGVSSHSGRRGLAAELVRRGASTTAVQMAGGWRSPQMVARYASGVAVEDGAVARFFGSGGEDIFRNALQ